MIREDELTTGTEAIRNMVSILQPNKYCVTLAEEVTAFYGTDFHFAIDPDETLSKFFAYTFYKGKMCIILKPNTGRERESLTHELLHANLLMKGFPWFDYPNDKWAYNLPNYIHHYLMFHDYQNMGLEIDKFNTTFGTLTNEEFDRCIAIDNEGNWCYRWTCNWVDEQIFGPDRYILWRESQWPHVLEIFPNLRQTTPRIQEWFECGDYASPERFITSYTQLVDIMKRTQIPDDCWFHLEPGNGKPNLIRHT